MNTQGIGGGSLIHSINLFLLCILFLVVVRMFLCALAAKRQDDGRFLLSDFKIGGLVPQSTDAVYTGEFILPYPHPHHPINWMLNRKKKIHCIHLSCLGYISVTFSHSPFYVYLLVTQGCFCPHVTEYLT